MPETKICVECKSVIFWVDYCADYVCQNCGEHYNNSKCWCGWKQGNKPLTIEDRGEFAQEFEDFNG